MTKASVSVMVALALIGAVIVSGFAVVADWTVDGDSYGNPATTTPTATTTPMPTPTVDVQATITVQATRIAGLEDVRGRCLFWIRAALEESERVNASLRAIAIPSLRILLPAGFSVAWGDGSHPRAYLVDDYDGLRGVNTALEEYDDAIEGYDDAIEGYDDAIESLASEIGNIAIKCEVSGS